MRSWMKSCVAVSMLAAVVSGCVSVKPETVVPEKPAQSSSAVSASEVQAAPITFTDALGRTVTLAEKPKQVAALMGSFADVWLLAGGQLAGYTEDALSERSLALGDAVLLGSQQEPSVEKMLEQQIDFAILSADVAEHRALEQTLEAAGVKTAYFQVEKFDDYLDMLKICTEITGDTQAYQANGTSVRAQIDAAIAKVPQGEAPKVLYIRAFSSGARAKGSDNQIGAMLKDLGCVNIADSEQSLLEDLSMEAIIAADPDFILVTTMGSSSQKALDALAAGIQANPVWASLRAVQEGRYVVLPKDLFHYKPNKRWGESYEMLVDILYGEP